ncbi:MAG: hypothetical protein FJZ59_01595 [Chlamydiae bacterium]|nr:hypothetical protein [Chlamydiota bacterium]
MRYFIGLLFFIQSVYLSSIEYVYLCDYEVGIEDLFSKTEVPDFHAASMWDKIKYLLNRQGDDIYGMKLHRAMQLEKNENRKFIISNAPYYLPEEFLEKSLKENLITIIWEPPSVILKQHTDAYYSYFSKVFTWDDSRVNGDKFIKFRYPVMMPMISELVPFSEKKLCTLIAANKNSTYKGEIYSERRRAIAYFNHFPEEFDLYGHGWNQREFSVYKGSIGDKIDTLKKYKFSICYENTVGMQGYITEKIFDCFQAGVVPVYLGSSNIENEVFANCFIDKRKFNTYEELHSFLQAISEEEYNLYIENIRVYLTSSQAKLYTENAFVLDIVNGLTGQELTFSDL